MGNENLMANAVTSIFSNRSKVLAALIVTINSADGADRTELPLTQDSTDDEEARLDSEKKLNAMLDGLKNMSKSLDDLRPRYLFNG